MKEIKCIYMYDCIRCSKKVCFIKEVLEPVYCKMCKKYISCVILLQSRFRGKIIRLLTDSFTKEKLIKTIVKYNELYQFYHELNKDLKLKKMRRPNYPSEITENIVKFAFKKKYGVMPCWDTKKGDLIVVTNVCNRQLEIKGSLDLFNGGPSSFGPNESWYRIYFVDCKEHYNFKFVVYEIKLSNVSSVWKKIKVNKTQTYEEQCLQGRRPRIKFNELIKQIPTQYIEIIFDDYVGEL